MQTLEIPDRADFCVGYFNLRGWQELDDHIRHWSDSGSACRLLVGMQKPPQEQLREALSLFGQGETIDNQSAIRMKKSLAEEFRRQLTFGAPNNDDEAGLHKLSQRLREKLLRAFWHAIERVTALDPTCGSGAFLFAALNILEPLNEACLERMEAFVEDLDRSGQKHRPEKPSDFRAVLERVSAHPDPRYFIFKSIIR